MIRRMKKEDLRSIYEIYCWYIRNSDACLAWIDPDEENFYLSHLESAAKYPYLVAEYENEIIGFGFAHQFLQKAAYQFDAELTIYFRQGDHHGMASVLYDRLEEMCREMGLVRLIGCTTASNEASLAFQEKKGFKKYGMLENAGFKGGKWHDVIWTHKRIAPLPDEPAELKQMD